MSEGTFKPVNTLTLTGNVCSTLQTRVTPAGIPITRFTLDHESSQFEAGSARKARCRIRVIACGESLQAAVKELTENTLLQVSGFISFESSRSEETRLVLHAESIRKLD